MQTKIRGAVSTKFGDKKEITKTLNQTLSEHTPPALAPNPAGLNPSAPAGAGSTAGEFNFDPTKLLNWRRQIQQRGGQNFLQRVLTGSDLTQKVEGEVRNIISKELHSLAPDTLTPDRVYSFYSKIHGDAPTWAKRIILGVAADQIFKRTGIGRATTGLLTKAQQI